MLHATGLPGNLCFFASKYLIGLYSCETIIVHHKATFCKDAWGSFLTGDNLIFAPGHLSTVRVFELL